ncbi:MAG: type II/IV secretion system ATPase subunit [Anaerolinea sp.]|nr:type II/IV secretion system ATPase subunit [Anaerolinea sp.]
MAQHILPFEFNSTTPTKIPADVFAQLPEGLQQACSESDFLALYVARLPLHEIGIPAYAHKLSRSMRDSGSSNVIYPTKEGLFVHIYPDATGARDHHISIEPTTVVDIEKIMIRVEESLLVHAEQIGAEEDVEAKKVLLIQLVERLCTTDARPQNGKGKSDKIVVTPMELSALKYRIIRDKIGLGVLQPLLLDPNIEDISCSGTGHVFVEHKIFRSVQSSLYFGTLDEVDEFVVWLGEWIKHPVTVRNPLIDAVLPDGSRINIVYGREISKRGSNFTIRKFSGTPTSFLELVEFGTMDYLMASYLSLMLEEGMNLFVVGATASGKTTTLNAITAFMKADAKIVTIEDTPEVYVPHKNWIQEMTRHTGSQNKGGDVGMFDLLKAALRQRPDRIIVGEIRSVEAAVAFQAMQTGHGVMSTFHAASVEKLIQRLTGDPINIPKTYVDNLNVVIIQSAVQLQNGKSARRILSINEIIGYDPPTDTFSFLEAFRWNPVKDLFEFAGYMNSYLLEQVIAIKRGIPPTRPKEIYNEVKRRAKVFERLHREQGVTDFNDLFKVLSEARRQKLL